MEAEIVATYNVRVTLRNNGYGPAPKPPTNRGVKQAVESAVLQAAQQHDPNGRFIVVASSTRTDR